MQPCYFLYRHVRLDKNLPFYIGVGTISVQAGEGSKQRFKRAYIKSGRNELWTCIANKTAFETEILFESFDRDFIETKEKEFIALYGRLSNNTGSLANLTDGGDYYPTTTSGSSLLGWQTTIQKGNLVARLNKLKEARKRKDYLGMPTKGIYVYDRQGNFVEYYSAITDCCSVYSTTRAWMLKCEKSNKCCKGFYFMPVYRGHKMEI